ncbi:hypothetical protein [Dyadobacter arcticus]|uniref:Uncharacterized protein n=1 Tax=Dyadobacter arcticus TaxID=1078754 RepID=A0ABX0UVV6_9BACT|nr:hypothetical protein [Dyadobacter arcticus]NIJ55965.1 hypothetical protein [Dyadobacter arcticus]
MTIRKLRFASITYLLLPNFIFFYSWTQFPINIAGILLLTYLLREDFKDTSFCKTDQLGLGDLIVLATTGIILALISGTAGLCYQTADYWCHNAKFHELFSQEWPIRIPAAGPVVSYYYGYYLVPALYFKIVGGISETFIFLWTAAGLSLGIAWLYLVLKRKIWFVLPVICVGDLPRLINNLFQKLSIRLYEYADFGIEHWSAFENLFWVPNQVIPSLITAGMLTYIIKNRLKLNLIIFPLSLTFWWAIFPAFTCSVLVGVLLFKELISNPTQIKWNSIIKNITLPGMIVVSILIFFLSHQSTPISGLIWNFRTNYQDLISEYLSNILLNVVIISIAYICLNKSTLNVLNPFPLVISLLLAIILPSYRIGKVNDFLFRGMIPLLIIMGLYIYYPLTLLTFRKTWHILRHSYFTLFIILTLSAGSLIAIGRIWRAATNNLLVSYVRDDAPRFSPIPYDAYDNVYEVLRDRWSQQEANQYLGKADSLYEKYIAP